LILFARRGGTVILEACAGLFDETGSLRSDSKLLGDLVGLKLHGVDCCELIWVGTFCASAPRNAAGEVSPVTRWAYKQGYNCPLAHRTFANSRFAV
jgi:hypothetical protein